MHDKKYWLGAGFFVFIIIAGISVSIEQEASALAMGISMILPSIFLVSCLVLIYAGKKDRKLKEIDDLR
jgi:hypothetical protein